MKFNVAILLMAIAASIGLGSCISSRALPARTPSASLSNIEMAVALLNSIESGDPAPAANFINPQRYIQHNLAAADGIAGFAAMMKALPPHSARVNVVRAFQDGDYVFTHTEYNFFGEKIGFDIFRFEDGKIVEHWDNMQKTMGPSPSGHSMIDGPTQATDQDQTEANKLLARSIIDDILIKGRMDKLAGYYHGDDYIQHNPNIADGVSGTRAGFAALAQEGVTRKYEQIHMVLGEGNFVLVVSEGEYVGAHSAFYDLFRIANGKIAEHWDTMSSIPAQEQWKNGNGKF
jgi:predicted SnoaL-like aldol condensation-catalyzing enzyme